MNNFPNLSRSLSFLRSIFLSYPHKTKTLPRWRTPSSHVAFTPTASASHLRPSTSSSRHVRPFEPRELEGGMDPNLFEAILVGMVSQAPMQRRLRSGKEIVLFFLATGAIRINC
ncbi:hypothetical protein FCM35_KLT18344 [Carex littledalei]|uniref:Uncharacterized protein n=1 Tax=Carex littledalei TaxID=544730 RepID=A0A833RAE1_9POAL|nr:hypothetical protein FCM35_KLT18344 [Carex littledalei]